MTALHEFAQFHGKAISNGRENASYVHNVRTACRCSELGCRDMPGSCSSSRGRALCMAAIAISRDRLLANEQLTTTCMQLHPCTCAHCLPLTERLHVSDLRFDFFCASLAVQTSTTQGRHAQGHLVYLASIVHAISDLIIARTRLSRSVTMAALRLTPQTTARTGVQREPDYRGPEIRLYSLRCLAIL